MSNINSLVRDLSPSSNQSELSSKIKFESLQDKLLNVIIEGIPPAGVDLGDEKPPKSGKGQRSIPIPSGKTLGKTALGTAVVGGVGYGGYKTVNAIGSALANRANRIEVEKQQELKQAASKALNQYQQKLNAPTPATLSLGGGQTADITKNTIAGKAGDAAQSMTTAAGQWGQTAKAGMGGIADLAARNPHLALAGTVLGGVAAFRKLRRK